MAMPAPDSLQESTIVTTMIRICHGPPEFTVRGKIVSVNGVETCVECDTLIEDNECMKCGYVFDERGEISKDGRESADSRGQLYLRRRLHEEFWQNAFAHDNTITNDNNTNLKYEDFLTLSAVMRQLYLPEVHIANPKLYYILSKLDRSGLFFDIFFDAGFTDVWLPFPERTLRKLIGPDIIPSFLRFQNHCLDRTSFDPLQRRHLSLTCTSELDLVEESVLGSGGYGEVHAVRHRQTRQLYAMKTLSRPGVHRDHIRWVNTFKRELHAMHRAQHHHCVELVASCTDLTSLTIICSPVADMDLSKFLDIDLDSTQKDILRCAVGCITSALAYLHSKNIRHDDLKPNNILIHGRNVLLTDFGFSLDFTDSGVSTTHGPPAHFVKKYSAPEVFDCAPRSRLTDIWGLGCVLFEIMSSLCGQKISNMKAFWQSCGTKRDSYAENQAATKAWYTKLTEARFAKQHEFHRRGLMMLAFIYTIIMEPDRLWRPTAAQVLDRMKDMDLVYPGTSRAGWVQPCCYHQTSYRPVISDPNKGRPIHDASGAAVEQNQVELKFDVPQWPILDAQNLDCHLVYIYTERDLSVSSYSENSPRNTHEHGNSDSRSASDLEEFGFSADHIELLRLGASAMLAQIGANASRFSATSRPTREHFTKSLFVCRLDGTPSRIYKLHFGPHASKLARYRVVQLTMGYFFPERQELCGRLFFVLIFDPRDHYVQEDPWTSRLPYYGAGNKYFAQRMQLRDRQIRESVSPLYHEHHRRPVDVW